jgi:DNA-binding transcriptional LysR family regulator
MTQPAVSSQIRLLEIYVSSALFERCNKKIVLTSTGLILYEHIKLTLMQYQNIETVIGEINNIKVGCIAISAATTCNHFISHMLADFVHQYDKINFSLDITNRAQLLKQLENYVPDFVVMGEPPAGLSLESEKIMSNPLVMIASPNYRLVRLAKKKQLQLKDTSHAVFVMREKGSGTRATIERHFKQQGHCCKSSFEMGSNEATKHAVISGLGIGIVPLHTIKMELESKNLVILNVKSLPIMRNWHIVTRKGKRLSPAANAFRTHILKNADKYRATYESVIPQFF